MKTRITTLSTVSMVAVFLVSLAWAAAVKTPSNLHATSITGSAVALAWSDHAPSYDNVYVERAPTGTGPWSVIATLAGSAAAYTDDNAGSGLASSTRYYYRVRGKIGSSYSSYSNNISALTLGTATLLAPTGLTAAAISVSEIDLGWVDNANNETGYYVERSTDGVVFVQVASLAVNAGSYADIGLAAATKYYYRVRAFNANGNSDYTNVANATTSTAAISNAPSSLAATVVSTSEIDLTWTDNASSETGFKVEDSLDNSSWVQISLLSANVTACKVTGLSANTLYYFRVRSYNGAGNSTYANTASATTLSITAGTVYYVATNGNDSTGTGAIGAPWLTIEHGLATMAGGDTLDIRAGTYNESSADGLNGLRPKSGVSWDQPTIVRAHSGETVIVKRNGGNYVFYFAGSKSYVSLESLIIDGGGGNTNSTVVFTDDPTTSMAPSHIQLLNCEVRNSKNQGIQHFLNAAGLSPSSKCPQDIRIIGGSVHDNGDGIFNGVADTTHEHGLYFSWSNSIIDGVTVYNNAALGIQMYLQEAVDSGSVSSVWASGNIIRNCVVHDNGRLAGITSGSTGLLVGCGTGNAVYNNVVYHQSVGIGIDWRSDRTNCLNNTCYDNRTNYRIGSNLIATNVFIENCVAWRPSSLANTTNNYTTANASTVTLSHNLNMTAGTAGTDPLFTAQTSGDFTEADGSPLIDTGIDLTALGVLVDIAGTARPQGSAYDIGAYER